MGEEYGKKIEEQKRIGKRMIENNGGRKIVKRRREMRRKGIREGKKMRIGRGRREEYSIR